MNKLRVFTLCFIVLSILVIIVGAILVISSVIDVQLYFNSFAIVTGVASVLGLITFILPRLSKKDVEEIGIEYFKQVIEASEELKKREKELESKEQALSSKQKELKELEIQKQEMEFLVRQMSMTLFLKDQYERQERRVKEIILSNKDLNNSIQELDGLHDKLIKLEEEIETDPNIDLLRQIMKKAKPKKEAEIWDYIQGGPFLKSLVKFFFEPILK